MNAASHVICTYTLCPHARDDSHLLEVRAVRSTCALDTLGNAAEVTLQGDLCGADPSDEL